MQSVPKQNSGYENNTGDFDGWKYTLIRVLCIVQFNHEHFVTVTTITTIL